MSSKFQLPTLSNFFEAVRPACGATRCAGCPGVAQAAATQAGPQRIEPLLSQASDQNSASGDRSRQASNADVLSTLEEDGSRRWLKPTLAKGPWWHKRRIVAYILMVIFVIVPHIHWSGKPLIRLDITARQFTILFHTFLPTDTLPLALTMLTGLIGIVFVTSVAGRAWCGWACPQTVYIEYLFRPIDRIFEGTIGKGGHAKKSLSPAAQVARFAIYLLLNMFLAHTFLAYFVGPEKLSMWIQGTPTRHPVAFIVMAATTFLLTYDFYFFREQTCVIACPYGRFQSVMLDKQSMIVAYDYGRGEPRKKGKHDAADQSVGDCVDCNQCVRVCPTGIDIRDGLQMECINCTQCIDACDDVMDKVGLPQGLIRYSSQAALEGEPLKFLRARTIIYPILLSIVAGSLLVAVSTKYGFDARIVRGKGAPFTSVARGVFTNSFNLRLVNRTDSDQRYTISVKSPPQASIEIVDEDALDFKPGQSKLVAVHVRFPSSLTTGSGNAPVELKIVDGDQNQRIAKTSLLGPRQ